MEYNLKLSQQEINIIAQSLGELPLKLTLNIFISIQNQVSKQDKDNAVSISSLDAGNESPDPDLAAAVGQR